MDNFGVIGWRCGGSVGQFVGKIQLEPKPSRLKASEGLAPNMQSWNLPRNTEFFFGR